MFYNTVSIVSVVVKVELNTFQAFFYTFITFFLFLHSLKKPYFNLDYIAEI